MIRRIAAAAAFATIAVPALATPLATPQCSVATGAQLVFGTVVALERTGDQTTDSASSFWINCNSEVTAAPQLYSPGPRVMQSGAQRLPFKLSLVSPNAGDLPTGSPGTALSFPRNGANQTVTLYGKILASDFKALPGGFYSSSISLTIEY
jgi:spore coat protein U-like protein